MQDLPVETCFSPWKEQQQQQQLMWKVEGSEVCFVASLGEDDTQRFVPCGPVKEVKKNLPSESLTRSSHNKTTRSTPEYLSCLDYSSLVYCVGLL